MIKLVMTDLDDTLLRSDKSISEYTLGILRECQRNNILIGFSTARGESNALQCIEQVRPDLVISSGGALVRYRGEVLYASLLSPDETAALIRAGRRFSNGQCEITVDTLNGHYWNYKTNPKEMYPDWGEVIYTDYDGFHESALKISIELSDYDTAKKVAGCIPECDCVKFSDSDWYKFTRPEATKKQAAMKISELLHISPAEMIAFGDDYSDIEMLQYCRTGVAVANAIPEVKEIADAVTESNENDGVAKYLEKVLAAE